MIYFMASYFTFKKSLSMNLKISSQKENLKVIKVINMSYNYYDYTHYSSRRVKLQAIIIINHLL